MLITYNKAFGSKDNWPLSWFMIVCWEYDYWSVLRIKGFSSFFYAASKLAVTRDTAAPYLAAAAASGSEGGMYFCFYNLPSSVVTIRTSLGPGLNTLISLAVYFFRELGLLLGDFCYDLNNIC